jgi:hypothetical protein
MGMEIKFPGEKALFTKDFDRHVVHEFEKYSSFSFDKVMHHVAVSHCLARIRLAHNHKQWANLLE